METSTLAIWNKALSACRAKGRLSGLDENSLEREICEEWYSSVLGTVQEAAMWDSTRTSRRLALLKERDFNEAWVDGDPEPPYKYKYALPVDYLRARQLAHGEQFMVGFDHDTNMQVLHTMSENAVLSYSRLSTDPTKWSHAQEMATVYGLAAHIAFPLSGLAGMVEKNIQLANALLDQARTQNNNNSNEVNYVIAPWHAARGASELELRPDFIYPLGQVFSVPAIDK